MSNESAQTQMGIGIRLGVQIIDENEVPSELVKTDGSLRVHAVNLGIMSFGIRMLTMVIGDGVTSSSGACNWDAMLILAASNGPKVKSQHDTPLEVTKAGEKVAFRTIGTVYRLSEAVATAGSGLQVPGHYESKPLDVFGTTA